MSRILFVSTSTTIGGAEKTLHTLATRLDRQRFEIAGVVSLKPKGEIARRIDEGGVRVHSLEIDSIAGISAARRLARIIEETKPDLVQALMYQAMQLCRFVKWRGQRFKLVSSPRVNFRHRSAASLWIDRLLRTQDDLLVSECEASARYLTERLGYDAARVMTIRNGVEPPPALAHGEREKARAELGAAPDEILLGAIGRLDRQKGYTYFLEAVAMLRVMHPVRAFIVGEGPDDAELKRLAHELRIADRVKFLGAQAEIDRWYSAMDFLVLPSLWEGLPNTALEAMSRGLAVVATNVDGVPEAVEDKATGLLCAPANAQALYGAIQELIVNPQRRREMGATARGRAAEKFRLADMIAAYESAYDRLLRGG